ncbi:MAG: GatB/YqeY domain-containing protein, partial [Myxococcota bacterium]
ESITAYEEGGRDDLVAQEKAELAVIETFLPSLADEATTRAWVEEAIAKTGASAPGDMGKVMGALMGAHKGELDGGLANRIVRELLAG